MDTAQVSNELIELNNKYPNYSGLTVTRNSGTPNSQIDVAWDSLVIDGIETVNKSFTLDITASGALGLDTGSEAVSTWYYVHAIWGASGVSAIMSTLSTSPTLPSGYTKSRLISCVYNDSGGDFRAYDQYNNLYCYHASLAVIVNSSVNATYSLVSHIPLYAYELYLRCIVSSGAQFRPEGLVNGNNPVSAALLYSQSGAIYCFNKIITTDRSLTTTNTAGGAHWLYINAFTFEGVNQ